MDASFWSDTFVCLASLVKRWSDEQGKSETLFAALLEFHIRLLTLTEDALPTLKERAGLEDTLPLLRTRHVHGVENLLAALQKTAERFRALHTEIAEVHAAAWQRHSAAVTSAESASSKRSSAHDAAAAALAEPAWDVVGAGRGSDAQRVGLPPPMVCIDWVQELDAMYAAEMLLKLELLDGIDLGAGAEVMQGVHRLWSLQPHLSTAAIERVAALAEALTLDS